MRVIIVLAVWLGCLQLAVAGMYEGDTTVVSGQKIEDVTVFAPRLRQAITSGKPIQVLDKGDLDLLGLTDMADAVRKFAGADVKDYGGIGGMKTVSVRNLGAQHTAVSYDGVTISNTQAGQIDIGRYSLDNIQSLSFAIGDNNDLMQTARHLASAGVLYIETERPHFDYGRETALRVKLRGGSFGLLNPVVNYWQKLGASTSLSVYGDFTRADGNYPFTLINGNETEERKRNNSDINAYRCEANLYQAVREGELSLKAYWFYSERGLPGSVVQYNTTATERLWDKDFFVQGSFRKRLSDTWQLNAHVKYVHSWNKYIDVSVKYQDGQLTEINRQNEYYASATVGWQPVKAFAVSLAQDIIYGNLRSNTKDPAQPNRFTSLTALTARYVLPRFEASAGVVGTFVTEDVEHGDKPEDRKRLSPTLSVSYRLMEKEALYLRAMLKHTFRIPTFNDLYYYQMGTVNLRPEKAKEYNIGVTWQGQPLPFTKYIQVAVDGYYDNVTDKIVAFPTLYVWKMANFGKVRMYGLNATLASEVSLTQKIGVILTAAYTLQHCIDVTDESKSYYKQQIPYTPKHTGNGSLVVKTPWVSVGYNVTACGERYSLQQQKTAYRLEPYWEHSVILSQEFALRKCRLNIQAILANLTNEQYEIVKYYPMPGRSWTLSGTLTF